MLRWWILDEVGRGNFKPRPFTKLEPRPADARPCEVLQDETEDLYTPWYESEDHLHATGGHVKADGISSAKYKVRNMKYPPYTWVTDPGVRGDEEVLRKMAQYVFDSYKYYCRKLGWAEQFFAKDKVPQLPPDVLYDHMSGWSDTISRAKRCVTKGK